MNDRYIFHDPIFRSNSKYPNLNLNKVNSNLLKLFRLLSGTINCKDDYVNKQYSFRKNYFILPYQNNQKISYQTLIDLFPEEFDIKTTNDYFKMHKKNLSFYEFIHFEIIKCLISNEDNQYVQSFFFLYRILEGISFTIPLIYSSKSKEFLSTYKQMKNFFSQKESDGELAFFKQFVSIIYHTDDFYKSTIDINLNKIDDEILRDKYYNTYLTLTNDKNIDDQTESEEIKFKFIGFYDFLINLRNRYFHLLQGTWQKNLRTLDILYPEYFFKPLIDPGINWISQIFLEIIKFDFENF